jgi:hypothetical protein
MFLRGQSTADSPDERTRSQHGPLVCAQIASHQRRVKYFRINIFSYAHALHD